jgi:hypothetical protein
MIEATLSRSGKTLTIREGRKEDHYDVEKLETHPAVAMKAYRLTKHDHTFYDIRLFEYGLECQCKAACKGDVCRHVRGLVMVELMPDVLPKGGRS